MNYETFALLLGAIGVVLAVVALAGVYVALERIERNEVKPRSGSTWGMGLFTSLAQISSALPMIYKRLDALEGGRRKTDKKKVPVTP